MKYEQTAWALRTKDGKWMSSRSAWSLPGKLEVEALYAEQGGARLHSQPGDRIVKVRVVLEVPDE